MYCDLILAVTLGGNPYPGVDNQEVFTLLKSGYRMPQPHNCRNELYELMIKCWDENPLNRPDFSEIKEKLDELLEASCGVTYLNLKNDSDYETYEPCIINSSSDKN